MPLMEKRLRDTSPLAEPGLQTIPEMGLLSRRRRCVLVSTKRICNLRVDLRRDPDSIRSRAFLAPRAVV